MLNKPTIYCKLKNETQTGTTTVTDGSQNTAETLDDVILEYIHKVLLENVKG
jgi:hypothetical protein